MKGSERRRRRRPRRARKAGGIEKDITLRLHASRESAGRFSYCEEERAVSSVVEHRPYKPRVAGSKPAPPTRWNSSGSELVR